MKSPRVVARQLPDLQRSSPTGSVRRKDERPRHQAEPSAFFKIEAMPARRYLLVRLWGIWDRAIFEAFAQDYLRAARHMMARGGVDHALVDASGFGFQTAEITEGFPALILESGMAHRTAIVISALVNKVQAKQAGELLDARYFRTVVDATDWLFSDEA